MTIKIISWNVNGIRAACKKGFNQWLQAYQPDIVCLQEIKASEEQMLGAIESEGYQIISAPAERPGYAGTAVLTKIPVTTATIGIDNSIYDIEGRTIISEYEHFILYNSYYPNGRDDLSRIPYKLKYYDCIIESATEQVSKGKNIILTGDFNTAHKEIDLARPKANVKNTGFRPEERAKLDELIDAGFTDTLRIFDTSPALYTWWSYRAAARSRNVGWRLDYFFVNKDFITSIESTQILSEVLGSDHCPIELVVK